MNQNIEILRGSGNGKDIYIIASGKSLDFIPSSFWENKIIIGVNYALFFFPCKYDLCHHYCVIQPMIDSGKSIVITSEAETCVLSSSMKGFEHTIWHDNFDTNEVVSIVNRLYETKDVYKNGKLLGDYYWYKHKNQSYTKIDTSVFNTPEYLIAGGSIVTTAIHFAYFLGAKNIILCGVDGGSLDNCVNYSAYPEDTNFGHMRNVDEQIRIISNLIRENGVSVTSVNPFVNFTLENHKFNK